jgi:hypothetical protein
MSWKESSPTVDVYERNAYDVPELAYDPSSSYRAARAPLQFMANIMVRSPTIWLTQGKAFGARQAPPEFDNWFFPIVLRPS